MNLLRLGPKLENLEWFVLWSAATNFASPPLINKKFPAGNPPFPELLFLNLDDLIMALRARMRSPVETTTERKVMVKLLALKELEKKS